MFNVTNSQNIDKFRVLFCDLCDANGRDGKIYDLLVLLKFSSSIKLLV